jgi:hypothetical protein
VVHLAKIGQAGQGHGAIARKRSHIRVEGDEILGGDLVGEDYANQVRLFGDLVGHSPRPLTGARGDAILATRVNAIEYTQKPAPVAARA